MARKLKKEEEQEEVRADLQELETYLASDHNDSESWGDKQQKAVVYEWEDFFTD